MNSNDKIYAGILVVIFFIFVGVSLYLSGQSAGERETQKVVYEKVCSIQDARAIKINEDYLCLYEDLLYTPGEVISISLDNNEDDCY